MKYSPGENVLQVSRGFAFLALVANCAKKLMRALPLLDETITRFFIRIMIVSCCCLSEWRGELDNNDSWWGNTVLLGGTQEEKKHERALSCSHKLSRSFAEKRLPFITSSQPKEIYNKNFFHGQVNEWVSLNALKTPVESHDKVSFPKGVESSKWCRDVATVLNSLNVNKRMARLQSKPESNVTALLKECLQSY